jgi:hypothetical protein
MIENIILHCSDSEWGDVPTIREWHVTGNGWRDIGYNIVILNGNGPNGSENVDGKIDMGRGLDFDITLDRSEKAAHTLGYNHNSIGVCLIGKKKFTYKQIESFILFGKMWKRIKPDIKIYGHYEMTESGKTCPNIDMDLMREAIDKDVQILNQFRGYIDGH